MQLKYKKYKNDSTRYENGRRKVRFTPVSGVETKYAMLVYVVDEK